MCGIVGICGKVDVANEQLLNRIKHRGPDDSGTWSTDHFTLGFVRLSIIDLSSAGHQPMVDEESGNVIIFNGEIYNYRELREILKADYRFRSTSDTEVILAAYRKWGTDALNHLRGMFSMAIYDKKRNAILAVRDRMGIKPFYYRQIEGGTIFSSEIKSLVGLPGIQDEVNELKAAEFLCARQLDCNEETVFKEVYQLQPGTFVWFDSDGVKSEPVQYWDFSLPGKVDFIDEKHGKEFRELFMECINIHLRSDVPVGAFVSGGLDSSSVASFILQDQSITELHTFSAILPVRNEENKLINLITDHPRVRKHEFYLDGKGFFDEVDKVIYHNDAPIQDGSMYSHFKLCEMAKAAGVKVLLSGAGGDELLGGYGTHVYAFLGSLLRKGRIAAYVKKARAISSNSGYSYSELIRKSLQENLPFSVRRLYKHAFFREVASHTHLQRYVSELPYFYNTNPDPWTANYLNNYESWTVPPYLHYEDRNSMAFGVEIRVPFFDHHLVEYISQFNPDSFIRGRSKQILRSSFAGIVPYKILNQKNKTGFPSPINTLLKDKKVTAPYYYENVKDIPFFDAKKTRLLGENFFNGRVDQGVFWRTLSLAVWYRQFFMQR